MTSMVDADRGRPAQASLAGVSTMLPPPPTVLWEEVAVPTPNPRRGRSPPLRTGQLQSHVDPPGFLLCHLFTSGWPRGIYLFYALGRDPVRLCSAAEPALALALGSSLVGSAVPDMPVHGGCCGLFPSTSLPRAISCSCLRVSVPPGSLVPSAGNGVRDHDLGSGMIIAARLWLLLSPLS